MVVAGEASGDMHGSEIVRYISKQDPSIQFTGMGSEKMRQAGVELLYDSANIAVVGIWEVIKHWSDIQLALKTLQHSITQNPPDLLLLIDYQEFNTKLAKFAKQHGVTVLFYISPQVWAWRQKRIKKFINRIDMMAVIFPFEERYYQEAGIPVTYVGHPLANKVKPADDSSSLRRELGLDPEANFVALLPGSRQSEIKRILPLVLESARLIKSQSPEIQFILPIANARLKETVDLILKESEVEIKTVAGRAYDAVACSQAAIVASGTATLEVALLQTPMAIVYKVSSLSYAILKRMIKVPFVGLANIVAEQQVAVEFIQEKAEPEAIANEISRLLSDTTYRNECLTKLQQVRQKLGEIDGVEGISKLAMEMLKE